MQQINPKVVAAYRKAQSAAAKLTVSENAYGNVSATHTPQQLSAATRAARRLGAEIRAAYPGATVAQEIEIRQRLQADGGQP